MLMHAIKKNMNNLFVLNKTLMTMYRILGRDPGSAQNSSMWHGKWSNTRVALTRARVYCAILQCA